ncbi:MAG: glycosyltransferase [Nitriliruptorales bacterium]|nr:glycosyltransferase [Nitriliruptorales bacterium]
MKVLMSADCIGGVWTYALELSTQLCARGHDVLLAVTGGELTRGQRRDVELLGIEWDARPFRLEWMRDAWSEVAAAGEWLLDLAEVHDSDVVHLNDYSHAALPWGRPVMVVAHSDVVTWWRAVHGADPPPEWERYRRQVARGLAAADLVVVPTEALREDLHNAYGITSTTTVVHNGRTGYDTHEAKRDVIVAAGRVWDEAKNVALAVRAADGLRWPLLVAGSGDVPGGGVLGPLEGAQLRRLLAQAQIFVEPARYEPFGLAALEAALARCALVLGDIASLREVWGDAATYIDPSDQNGLRAALQSLIDDRAALTERQAAAAERAARFSPQIMATAYEQLYAWLCGDRAGQVQTRS